MTPHRAVLAVRSSDAGRSFGRVGDGGITAAY